MKLKWIFIGAPMALMAAPFLVPRFAPWSGINCEHQEINIKSGQARYSRCFWFLKLSERVEDTALSRVLKGTTVDVAKIEPWQRVNTFSPGVHYSPHYGFHGALSQARDFATLQGVHGLREMDASNIARQVLIRWQTNGNYQEVGRFLANKMTELESGGLPQPNN